MVGSIVVDQDWLAPVGLGRIPTDPLETNWGDSKPAAAEVLEADWTMTGHKAVAAHFAETKKPSEGKSLVVVRSRLGHCELGMADHWNSRESKLDSLSVRIPPLDHFASALDLRHPSTKAASWHNSSPLCCLHDVDQLACFRSRCDGNSDATN